MSPRPWPYPFWIAHRGAGSAAPENTLAAFRSGLDAGFKMFECDVKLSYDQQPFLLHDDTLDRTTNGDGPAHIQTWSTLQTLDAGFWHSPRYAGEPMATLAQVSRFCLSNHCQINLELKPTPGAESLTGEVTAKAIASLWREASHMPLLSSFSDKALLAAYQAAPFIARGLLIDTLETDWLSRMRAADCQALICNHQIITAELISQVHSYGCYCLAYTVNDPWTASDLICIGIDGIITDQMDLPEHMRSRSHDR